MKWKDILGKDCKIIVKESTTPFYLNQNPKKNPNTNAIFYHTELGLPIYYTTELTTIMTKVNDRFERKELHTIIPETQNTTVSFTPTASIEEFIKKSNNYERHIV
jgi:hypothetical protein